MHSPQHQHATNENITSSYSTSTAANSLASARSNHQFPLSMVSRTGGFNPMFSNLNSRMNSGIQPLQANAKVVDLGNEEQWEDKFKEIDEQFQELSNQVEEQVAQESTEKEEEIVIDDKDQTNFQEVWDALERENEGLFDQEPASWEKDFATYAQGRANFGQYKFEQSNQFMNSPNAYEIGLTLMANGAKLSEAALAFEAAIQENPNHVDAWLKLGEVQTQNEKEIAGLTALEKCLSLDPNNLSALMTLAVSYINEGYDNAAFATLERWIETKYPQITDKARSTNPKINDEDRYSLHKRVIELFIQAAQLSPSGANIDADVQMGLGVLFYANEDYDKTIDCFKAALAVRPDDELLWNRLGASLANSNRAEEAIDAYHKALQLKPSFVRARYNLGVSSINIGCFKEAAEHLLGALSMHNVEGLNPNDSNFNAIANQSTSILETLKRSFIAMDRRDLLEKVRPGMDLNQFRQEFNF
jgi:peroxin-5